MQAGEEIARGFFVAGRDASELFDELKETLDEVAFGVKGESIIAYSLSGSSANVLKKLSHTPLFAHRENRV